MKRRHFLKSSIGFTASSFLMMKKPALLAGFSNSSEGEENFGYRVGDKISPEVFVFDKEKEKHALLPMCAENFPKLNVLYIFGGGALGREDKTGGLWCQDTFEDLYIMRYLKAKYAIEPIEFIPVACPPIYSMQYYGFDKDLLLSEPDDSEKVMEATDKFIESTLKAFDAGLIPVEPYFDLRYRLLFNRDYEQGEGYGEVHAWQGKFRADDEFQKYGVPTIWLLDTEGKLLEGPFHGNIYHSEPYQINYTVKDIDEAILKYY